MVSFPYYSHIFGDSYGSGMGIAWETSHKGVPLLKVPGITLDSCLLPFKESPPLWIHPRIRRHVASPNSLLSMHIVAKWKFIWVQNEYSVGCTYNIVSFSPSFFCLGLCVYQHMYMCKNMKQMMIQWKI